MLYDAAAASLMRDAAALTPPLLMLTPADAAARQRDVLAFSATWRC